MSNLKRTVKLGNWQEEKALEAMMGGKVYDPRIKRTSNLTSLRVIEHSDKMDPKEYVSVLKDTHHLPQVHKEFARSDGLGPKARLREQLMRERVEAEFAAMEEMKEKERNQTYFVTTSQEQFAKAGFTSSLRDSISGLSSGRHRCPYYLDEPPITYYLYTALHSDNIPFPVTTIGSLNRPWAKGVSFSSGEHA